MDEITPFKNCPLLQHRTKSAMMNSNYLSFCGKIKFKNLQHNKSEPGKMNSIFQG